jgi:hypothetical protein
MPQETIRSGWMRIRGRGRPMASAWPRISIPRGRQGSVLARSSMTIAARLVRSTSRYFFVRGSRVRRRRSNRARGCGPTSPRARRGVCRPCRRSQGERVALPAHVLELGAGERAHASSVDLRALCASLGQRTPRDRRVRAAAPRTVRRARARAGRDRLSRQGLRGRSAADSRRQRCRAPRRSAPFPALNWRKQFVDGFRRALRRRG